MFMETLAARQKDAFRLVIFMVTVLFRDVMLMVVMAGYEQNPSGIINNEYTRLSDTV